MEKKRFNIERLACMGTIIFIVAIVVLIFADDKNLVWQISLGGCFFLPGAYYTYFYLSNGRASMYEVFFQSYTELPVGTTDKFSWMKYLQEFVVFCIVIIVVIIAALIYNNIK